MARERGGAAAEQTDFAQTLATLKRNGSNVLLVGTETVDAHAELCHRLMGDSDDESRYRLVVTGDHDSLSGVAREPDDRTVRTIDYSTLELEATADAESSGRTPLGTLAIRVIEAVDEFEDAADGLESSQLRVCVDSLVRLLEEHTAEKVFRLLHMTTSRVVHVQGMGHYHLPLERDHEAVRLFEPLFDAVVEIRTREDAYEQRWELRDREQPTDWIPL